MQEASWWMDIIRPFLYSLDKIVYGLINTLYNLFIFVSDLTIFNEGDFAKFTNKVYLVLGIVMLFKIAFSLITLFANPDDIMDSNKGVTGIVKRIIISLIVITFVPTIFQTAYQIQTIVLHDNIIGNFFLGDITNETGPEEDKHKEAENIQKNAGKMVSFSILSAFYYPEEFVIDKDKSDANKIKLNTDGWSSDACAIIRDGEHDVLDLEKKCGDDLYQMIATETYDIDAYGAFVNQDKSTSGDKYYVMHYMYLISTVAGIAVAWIFFGFCFDTAIRAVKLSVLQLIAPIPVFSYIDPKKGETIFKNWYTTCISTYIGLFMRLVLIFFVIYICYIIGSSGHGILQINAEGEAVAMQSSSLSIFAKALIMFGVLYFATSAPKLFNEMFGIKSEGSFGTKLSKMGMAGTALAVGVGGAKYLGGRYRRTLQKASNRKKISELEDKIDSGQLDEDDGNAQIAKLKDENRWRNGLKQNFNATRYGLAAGFAGGFGAGKISKSGFQSALKDAHLTEKNRNKGTSYMQEKMEKINTLAGVPDKYGGFSKFRAELKDLQNNRHDAQMMENRLNEGYTDMYTSIVKDYKISAADMSKLDKLIKKDNKTNEEIKELASIKDVIAGKNNELYGRLDELESFYEHVRVSNKKGQDYEKQIKDVQSKINAVHGDKK